MQGFLNKISEKQVFPGIYQSNVSRWLQYSFIKVSRYAIFLIVISFEYYLFNTHVCSQARYSCFCRQEIPHDNPQILHLSHVTSSYKGSETTSTYLRTNPLQNNIVLQNMREIIESRRDVMESELCEVIALNDLLNMILRGNRLLNIGTLSVKSIGSFWSWIIYP